MSLKTENIILNKKSKVYVLCPAYIKSGGPELLHQLVKKMNDKGINAYIVYYNTKKDNKYRDNEFDKYTKEYININEIEDDNNNLLIMPEAMDAIYESKKFKNIRKAIWWLSVDNFLKSYRFMRPIKIYRKKYIELILKNRIIYNFKYIKTMLIHLCQSHYAIQFLKDKKIDNVIYLSDYINDTYLKVTNGNNQNRENIVLYNPKKGLKFTKCIMKKTKDLKWIPIQNMTTQQVKELLLKSKVYIDFGQHPGKDRFPREAAMCGCCVITGKRGSAYFYEDVPIQEEFKFEDKKKKIPQIIEKITQCLTNYELENRKFDEYRNYIKGEEKKFEQDIDKIFLVEE